MGKEQAGQEKKEDTKEVHREERIAKIMQAVDEIVPTLVEIG